MTFLYTLIGAARKQKEKKSVYSHLSNKRGVTLIDFEKENFFFPSVFLLPRFKVYKKVIKFSFKQQRIFWVLVSSIRIWYLAYPMDRSKDFKRHFVAL